MVDQIYAALAGQTQPEHMELGVAPGETGHIRSLPHITINDLAGFLEHLAEAPGHRHDIYRLAEELRADSDHLLRLTEVAELLGFATIGQGDIALTPLGETFAEASILARKEIFATRIRRVPIFRWLLALLGSAPGQRLKREVIQTALELEFPPDEADRQIEIAVNWGRYAELLAYDDVDEVIFLEPAGSAGGIS
jgi:NitT/TauT family transport system ATP-binding protein